MSGGRRSSESTKRMRATPPSPISGSIGAHAPLAGAAGGLAAYAPGGGGSGVGGPPSHLPTSGTSSSTAAAVARYVDDDINFLRDLREINRVERDQLDRNDTPIDARIHSNISNGTGNVKKDP